MKRERRYSPETRRALSVFGKLIAAERRAQRRPLADLAERAGVSLPTVTKVERGDAGTAIGTVLEIATLLGIRLFPDLDEVNVAQRLALVPAHVYPQKLKGDDDF
jgi:transcriptional regulator with XRE-family HTH domain